MPNDDKTRDPWVSSIGVIHGKSVIRIRFADGSVVYADTNTVAFAQLAQKGVRVVNEL